MDSGTDKWMTQAVLMLWIMFSCWAAGNFEINHMNFRWLRPKIQHYFYGNDLDTSKIFRSNILGAEHQWAEIFTEWSLHNFNDDSIELCTLIFALCCKHSSSSVNYVITFAARAVELLVVWYPACYWPFEPESNFYISALDVEKSGLRSFWRLDKFWNEIY